MTDDAEIVLMRKKTAEKFDKIKNNARELIRLNKLLAIIDDDVKDLTICEDCRKKNKKNIMDKLAELGV